MEFMDIIVFRWFIVIIIDGVIYMEHGDYKYIETNQQINMNKYQIQKPIHHRISSRKLPTQQNQSFGDLFPKAMSKYSPPTKKLPNSFRALNHKQKQWKLSSVSKTHKQSISQCYSHRNTCQFSMINIFYQGEQEYGETFQTIGDTHKGDRPTFGNIIKNDNFATTCMNNGHQPVKMGSKKTNKYFKTYHNSLRKIPESSPIKNSIQQLQVSMKTISAHPKSKFKIKISIPNRVSQKSSIPLKIHQEESMPEKLTQFKVKKKNSLITPW